MKERETEKERERERELLQSISSYTRLKTSHEGCTISFTSLNKVVTWKKALTCQALIFSLHINLPHLPVKFKVSQTNQAWSHWRLALNPWTYGWPANTNTLTAAD